LANLRKDVKEVKRRRILRTAAELFASRHYHEVNTDDIARSAKIAKGSLYNYFKSKDDLYYSIINDGLDRLIRQFSPGIPFQGNSFLELNYFVLNFYSVLSKNKFIFQVFQKEKWRDRNSRRDVLEKFDTLKNILRRLLRQGVEAHEMRPMNVEVTAELIFGMVESIVMRVYQREGERGDILEIFNMLLEGVGTSEKKEELKRFSNFLFSNCFPEWNNCFDQISKQTLIRDEIRRHSRLEEIEAYVATG
jgi:AcrR family transcriptional regulator